MEQKKLNEAINTLQSFLEKPIEEIKATVTDFDKANALFEVILSRFLPIYSELVLKTKIVHIEINYNENAKGKNGQKRASFDVRFRHNFDFEHEDKIVLDD